MDHLITIAYFVLTIIVAGLYIYGAVYFMMGVRFGFNKTGMNKYFGIAGLITFVLAVIWLFKVIYMNIYEGVSK